VNCDVFTPLLVVAFNQLEPLVLLQVLPSFGCYSCVMSVLLLCSKESGLSSTTACTRS
jgi:hypothetical protein